MRFISPLIKSIHKVFNVIKFSLNEDIFCRFYRITRNQNNRGAKHYLLWGWMPFQPCMLLLSYFTIDVSLRNLDPYMVILSLKSENECILERLEWQKPCVPTPLEIMDVFGVQRYLQEKNRNSTTHSHFWDQLPFKGSQCTLKVTITNLRIRGSRLFYKFCIFKRIHLGITRMCKNSNASRTRVLPKTILSRFCASVRWAGFTWVFPKLNFFL